VDQDSEKERAEYTKYMLLAVNIFSCNKQCVSVMLKMMGAQCHDITKFELFEGGTRLTVDGFTS
jgi:hypothetical protein